MVYAPAMTPQATEKYESDNALPKSTRLTGSPSTSSPASIDCQSYGPSNGLGIGAIANCVDRALWGLVNHPPASVEVIER